MRLIAACCLQTEQLLLLYIISILTDPDRTMYASYVERLTEPFRPQARYTCARQDGLNGSSSAATSLACFQLAAHFFVVVIVNVTPSMQILCT